MATEQVIEQVADEIEEVAEVTRRLSGRDVGFFGVGVGLGVAAGFAAGYFVMEKRLKTKYEKLTEAEVDKMRKHYQKKVVASAPKPSVEEIIEAQAREQQAIDEVNELFPEEPVQVNVFDEETWDYAVETKDRDPEVPYIIHVDEFTQNEPEHEQATYTYYEVDDILADSRDITIDDMDEVIGLGNLGHWGHGSNNDDIVYVRNEVLKIDVEIIRDRGSFREETGRNIRHSSDRRRKPKRTFDDD